MIKIENVSKVFLLPGEKRQTLKDNFVNMFNRNKYNRLTALDNLNLEIKKGEFVGIIGRNGSGKSTLLKLIAGIYPPTEGSISVSGRISAFLELGVGFHGELSVRDNVYLYGAVLGVTRKQINRKFDSIIDFAGIKKFENTKLRNLSSGMQIRIAFATAIQSNADIFLVDEVLAVGDAEFQNKCFKVFENLKKKGKTVLFVSHDLGSVKKFCGRCILLENGMIKKEGKPEEVIESYYRTLA